MRDIEGHHGAGRCCTGLHGRERYRAGCRRLGVRAVRCALGCENQSSRHGSSQVALALLSANRASREAMGGVPQ